MVKSSACRQVALLAFLLRYPSAPRYALTQPGSNDVDAVKRRLALAWLSHRLQDDKDESSAQITTAAMRARISIDAGPLLKEVTRWMDELALLSKLS